MFVTENLTKGQGILEIFGENIHILLLGATRLKISVTSSSWLGLGELCS